MGMGIPENRNSRPFGTTICKYLIISLFKNLFDRLQLIRAEPGIPEALQ
jgi:hypothetical protein